MPCPFSICCPFTGKAPEIVILKFESELLNFKFLNINLFFKSKRRNNIIILYLKYTNYVNIIFSPTKHLFKSYSDEF